MGREVRIEGEEYVGENSIFATYTTVRLEIILK